MRALPVIRLAERGWRKTLVEVVAEMEQAKSFDAVVIGGGVLGCFAARALCRRGLRVAVAERREDVCTGVSRANTAIVYGGYDTHPGTLKTRLTVASNRQFDQLCSELGVRFRRCGSLMVAFGPRGVRSLERKLEQGRENGVEGLRILNREETLKLEPALSPAVEKSLWCPGVGTVDPWELCLAAAENAADNGTEFLLNTEVTGLRRLEDGYEVETDRGTLRCRAVVNCAGLQADRVAELLHRPTIRIVPTKGDYFVLDTPAGELVRHVIFHEPEEKGKGLTVVPTVDGNILLGPSEEAALDRDDRATEGEGLDFLRTLAGQVVTGLPLEQTIRTFAAVRPNPYEALIDPETGAVTLSQKSIGEFMVTQVEEYPGMVSFIGVKTPGLTCAWQLGEYAAALLEPWLGHPSLDSAFRPEHQAPVRTAELAPEELAALIARDPAYGRLVCRCRRVSEGEIRDAVRRSPGAVTVDGIKYRTGAGMGRCQGSRCTQRVVELLARELGVAPGQVEKGVPGSWIIRGAEDDGV